MKKSNSSKKLDLSILIPTYKEAEFIGVLLDSILQQETTLKYEIIIVNRKIEGDDTDKVIKKYKEVKYSEIVADKDTRNMQRNLAIEKAKSDWVLMLDGDMISDGNLLEAIRETLLNVKKKDVGFVITEYGVGFSYWCKVKAHEKNLLIGNRYSEVARLYRKETLLDIGGYPEDIIGGEDKHLENKMSALGDIHRVKPGSLTHSEGSLTLRQLLKVKSHYANTMPSLRTGKTKAKDWSIKDFFQIMYDGFIRFMAPFHPRSWGKMIKSPLMTISLIVLRILEWGSSVWAIITRIKNTEKKSKLLLLGAYGQKNLGDDLLLQSFLDRFSQDYYVTAKVDDPSYLDEIKNKYDVEFQNFYGLSGSFKLLKGIITSKTIIFGGGTLLFKCNSGFIRDRLYLKLYLISLLGRLTRSKVIIAHGGINNEDTKVIKFLLRRIYKVINKIVLRDDVSRIALLEAIGNDSKNKIFVATDIVWSYDGLDSVSEPRKKKKIAISLLGNHNIKDRENVMPDVLLKFSESLKKISDSIDVQFLFIPYLKDGSPIDDSSTIEDLTEVLDKSVNYKIFVPHEEKGYPTNVIEEIGNTDLMISSRLHSIITCVLSDILPIELSYGSKCDAQMAQLYLDDECLDYYNFESKDLSEIVLKYIKDDTLKEEKLRMVRSQRKYFQKLNDDAFQAIQKELK